MSGGRRQTRAEPAPIRAVAVVASLLFVSGVLGACAPRGDFGRPAPSIIADNVLPFAGTMAASMRGEPASWFMLTDDERELRRRSWRFLMPAHEGQAVEAVFADLSRTRVLPPLSLPVDGYSRALLASRGSSPAPLFRRIAEDAHADRQLLDPFAALAARVIETDEARLQMLLHVSRLEEGEAREAAARVAENRCLVAWVREEAAMRTARYRHALERLVIAAPQREAIDAERALTALEAQVARLEVLPVGQLAACAGHSAHQVDLEPVARAHPSPVPGPDGVIPAKK